MNTSLTQRRGVLIAATVLVLIAAGVCGSFMRRSTPGAADPDSQEITTAEVNATIGERIAAMGTYVTAGTIRSALQDQLPLLGTYGFIRVHIVSMHIDVLAGTDYGVTGDERSASAGIWQDRLSLAPVGTPGQARPIYVLYANTGMGKIWGELIIGSAGPTAAQVRASVAFMTAMWVCVGLAALCVTFLFLPAGTRRQTGAQHGAAWYGCLWMMVGILVMTPVVWLLAAHTLADARTAFARIQDGLVTAVLQLNDTQDSDQWATNTAYAFHQSLDLSSPGGFIRLMSSGKEVLLLGTDYGSASVLGSADISRWMSLAPVAGGAVRRLYVTSDGAGDMTFELGTGEPDYWQMRRLRWILSLVVPAMLMILFAIGYSTHRQHREICESRTPDETVHAAVLRQALLTMLVVVLTLAPAAGLISVVYHEVSLSRLDQQLQTDAAALRGQLRTITSADLQARAPSLLEGLPVMQNGAVLRIQSGREVFYVGWSGFELPLAGAIPVTRMVVNHWDYSLAPNQKLPVRVINVSDTLKDGTLYSFALATTFRQVMQDMRELWTAAAWAAPLVLLFIALAGVVSARLALHPVAASMRRLEQFTGDAGHELRTPLSSIRLNAQVALNQDQQPDEFRRHLTAIASQAERSTHLSESLLLLARLDREQHAPLVPVQLLDIWGDLHTAFADQLATKGLTLQAPSEALTIAANRDLLTVALDNLVENAVRYAPEGTAVAITVQQTGRTVTIAVTDQGPGMPPEALPHIWDRFTRIDPSRSRESGGSGLGLAIVRKAVEAMHGHVAVTSKIGMGSMFSIILPDGTANA
ncbi:MAG: HAMP domain-containing sensor histidine kinase [Caldiserica bacterium]|nr:HAMP domain-containing sensor histidine kinase [Caldisericota bacterium]